MHVTNLFDARYFGILGFVLMNITAAFFFKKVKKIFRLVLLLYYF